MLALLPEYAGLEDAVAGLRAACLDAVGWLAESGGDVTVLADAQGRRVGQHLLALAGGFETVAAQPPQPPTSQPPTPQPPKAGAGAAYLVVANGSACRGEKAPGHLDERSFAFDDSLRAALTAPDPSALADLDRQFGDELLAGPVSTLRALGGVLTSGHRVSVDYDEDPFGVQYWVMRWACES